MKSFSLLSSLLLASSLLSSVISAAPLDHVEKRASFVPVQGVTGNGQGVRLELRTMQTQHPTLFALYLLGLKQFKAMPQSNVLSYYQIAGIHGRPYIAWDGDSDGPNGDGYGAGYCTHVSNLFLPWHRPYLALFEQQLYAHVQNVASKYSPSVQAAAKAFRIPYWDWAADPCSNCAYFPSLISQKKSTFILDGKKHTIHNPLYRYKFTNSASARANAFQVNPFAEWKYTERYPTSFDAQGVSQDQQVNVNIKSNQANLKSRVYNLLTNYGNFTRFGNEAWLLPNSGTGGTTDSLESVHDAIHSLTGGNGDMTYLDYSAFDPVFWLHHANVDRLFALWQNIHGSASSSYVEPMAQTRASYWYTEGEVEGPNSVLAPFHLDSNGAGWTSASARSIASFHYTYPELSNGNNVVSQINALYNSNSVSRKRDAAADAAEANSTQRFYTANIVSQKFELKGTYNIYVFIGDVPDETTDWADSGNLVGIHAVLANLADDSTTPADLLVSGTVPLTDALNDVLAVGDIADLDPETVEPFLQDYLSWRVLMADGTEVPVDQLTGFSVSVVTADFTPPATPDSLPTWGDWEGLPNATLSQPGGHDDQYWDVPAHQKTYNFVASELWESSD